MTVIDFLLYFLVLSLPLSTSRSVHARTPPSAVDALSFAPLPAAYKAGLNRRMQPVAITPVGSPSGSPRGHFGSEPPRLPASSQGVPIRRFETDAPAQQAVLGVPVAQPPTEAIGVPVYPQAAAAPPPSHAMNQQQAPTPDYHRKNACAAFGLAAAGGCAAIGFGVGSRYADPGGNWPLVGFSAASAALSFAAGVGGASEVRKMHRAARRPHGQTLEHLDYQS